MSDSWKLPRDPVNAWYVRYLSEMLMIPPSYPAPRRDPRGQRKEAAKGVQKRNRRQGRRRRKKGR